MFKTLAQSDTDRRRHETEFALEFEQPGLITLGLCYEQNGRFSGGAKAADIATAASMGAGDEQ